MSQVDEGLIHAWLDGQLHDDEAARVERLVATDAAWGAAAAEARGLVAGASRILGALDDVPSVVRAASTATRNARARQWRGPAMRAAAALVVVAGLAGLVWRGSPTPQSPKQESQTELRHEPVAVVAQPANTPVRPTVPTARAPKPVDMVTSATAANAGRAEVKDEMRKPIAAVAAETLRASAAAGAPTRDASAMDVRAPVRPLNEVAARSAAVSGASGGRGALVGDVGVAQLSAKSLSLPQVDAQLAGCWEPVDAPATNRSQRVDARAERDGFVLRFVAPTVTDLVRPNVAPPAAPPTASVVAAGTRVQNTAPRKLNDSTYITEWFQGDAAQQLTFVVRGDTLRGTTARVTGTVVTPGAPFAAVRRACAR